MKMDMLVDSCACDPSEISAKIESLRMADFFQSFLQSCGELHYLRVLFGTQCFKLACVFVRYHHYVAAVVGIEIHDGVAVLAACDDEILVVLFLAGDSAKEARGRPRRRKAGNVFGSPRRKEAFQIIDWLSDESIDSFILLTVGINSTILQRSPTFLLQEKSSKRELLAGIKVPQRTPSIAHAVFHSCDQTAIPTIS